MRIVILGVGDAFTGKYFGSSALLLGPRGAVLLDCPDPIHRVLREGTGALETPIGAHEIDDILLTHIHGDHSNGLESFGFWRWMLRERGEAATKPRVWTSPWTAQRLWSKLAPAMSGEGRRSGQQGPATRSLETFFEVRTIEPGLARFEEVSVAGLTVTARWTTHPIPTMGLLISDGRATLGWASDTAYEREHLEWLAQADLIVHEANTGPAHTPIDTLNALPADIRRKMRLIHLPDEYDPSSSDIRPLTQGEVLDLL